MDGIGGGEMRWIDGIDGIDGMDGGEAAVVNRGL